MNDRLFSRLLAGSAPLLVWAAHFFLCYTVTAATCARGGGGAGTRAFLLLASLAALAALAWMLARRRHALLPPGVRLLDRALAWSALLALLATFWTTLPLLVLRLC